MTWRRKHDDKKIGYILDISNENTSDFSSSDSYYEITNSDLGERHS
jgi:hypothetical protein